jgi:hypothetical protein
MVDRFRQDNPKLDRPSQGNRRLGSHRVDIPRGVARVHLQMSGVRVIFSAKS